MFRAAILASVGMGATATNRVLRPGAVTRARPLHTVRRRREQSLRPPEAHSLPACPMRFERQSNPHHDDASQGQMFMPNRISLGAFAKAEDDAHPNRQERVKGYTI